MEENEISQMSETTEESKKSAVHIDNLLCYASTARHSMKSDEIVRICVAFYKENDIIKSKDYLCGVLGEKPKRRRNKNRLMNEMKDIIELLTRCDDNNICLPRFVADYFDALPPTSGFEVISNYIMQLNDELINLRKEVNLLKEGSKNNDICNPDVAFIKEDLLEIKGEIRKLNHKLLDDNIRRDSLILECIENTSKNGIVDDDKEIISYTGETRSRYKEHPKSISRKGKSVSESPPQAIEEKLSPSAPSTSQVSYWQREIQDFGGAPSAPTYADVASARVENVTGKSNVTVASSSNDEYENNQEITIVNENFRRNKPQNHERNQGEREVVNSKSVHIDDEGYQLVRKKRRPVNIVGSKRTKGNETIRGAVKVADIYLGNCELDVTPVSISDYIFKEMNITVNKCEALVSRNENSKSFKVSLNLRDREKLLSPEVWPEGIICRKFYSGRK